MNNTSNYLKNITTISSVLFLLVGTLNYVVNPFNIFNIERISGINEFKPEAAQRIRVYKKYQPISMQPRTLLVGNSRIEMGLDPKNKSFRENQPVYNLGIPGIGVKGQLAYAQHVINNSNVKMVIVSVDFREFLSQKIQKSEKPMPLEVHELQDKFSSISSLDSLKASISTLFGQSKFTSNRLKNGFNPASDYLPIIRYEGQYVLFKQNIDMLNEKLHGRIWSAEWLLTDENSPLSILVSKIDEWLASGISISLFINPYHEDYYSALKSNGFILAFDEWRGLIKNSFSSKLKFCDFTSLGQKKSNEKLNDNELKYFWEPAHYKKSLGDLMLPKILKGCSN